MSKYYCLARYDKYFLLLNKEAVEVEIITYTSDTHTLIAEADFLSVRNNSLRPFIKRFDSNFDFVKPSQYFTKKYSLKYRAQAVKSFEVLPIDTFKKKCETDSDYITLLLMYGLDELYDMPIIDFYKHILNYGIGHGL